ncbi:hypothetical protein M7I_0539 [Glarea lozoyensis 74030]|uniref:Uncharacterized protein n=1 Tax=Glarea lozoyensis (strain ATCC 74030 / MF5533) TaxID=1104152 RepID=H0EDT2_GLAL7|nr:hypothetical protein M7I_0539 [Glarea lozoyensis 74030]
MLPRQLKRSFGVLEIHGVGVGVGVDVDANTTDRARSGRLVEGSRK